ncbi:MAG: hypothetical protein U0354_17370 [Candidatus Sericytochromatia bacterium]
MILNEIKTFKTEIASVGIKAGEEERVNWSSNLNVNIVESGKIGNFFKESVYSQSILLCSEEDPNHKYSFYIFS